MIIANRKPIKDLLNMIEGRQKILILGCRGCVAVCSTGGDKEVSVLASAIRLGRKQKAQPVDIDEMTFVRQCDTEYLEPLKSLGKEYDAVLSMACGVGINLIADTCPDVKIFPAVNTTFYGANPRSGEWKEMCAGCGACGVHNLGGFCPVARCAKNLLNGPCGGSVGGRCEVNPDTPCVWHMIYNKMSKFNESKNLEKIMPAKDWRPAGHGGPRNRKREDLTA